MYLRYWTVNHENCHREKVRVLKMNVQQDIELNNQNDSSYKNCYI